MSYETNETSASDSRLYKNSKRIAQRVDMEWEQTKNDWKDENPPDHMGYWYCVIGYGALTDGRRDALGGLPLNLDHDISRVRDGTRRYDHDNLNPMCPRHNREKGSRSLYEYRQSNPKKRCGI